MKKAAKQFWVILVALVMLLWITRKDPILRHPLLDEDGRSSGSSTCGKYLKKFPSGCIFVGSSSVTFPTVVVIGTAYNVLLSTILSNRHLMQLPFYQIPLSNGTVRLESVYDESAEKTALCFYHRTGIIRRMD